MRTALSGLSGSTETMGALERRLRKLRVTDDEQARNAWEDAWLETGIGIVRADSAVRSARGRGAEAALTADDAKRVRQQLATLGARWEHRYRAVADRLERVGLRIHALGALALPAATPADPPPEGQRPLEPAAARALSPVTRPPVGAPTSVVTPPQAAAHPRPAERPAAVASWPPSRDASAPMGPDRPGRPTSPWEGRPVLTRPAVGRRPVPPPAPEPSVGGQAVKVLLVLLVFIGLVVTAALAFELLV